MKTQALYVAVFVTRYLDLFYEYVSLYNSLMKFFFLGSSCYILYLMRVKFRYVIISPRSNAFHVHVHMSTFDLRAHKTLRISPSINLVFSYSSSPTNDPSIDTFRVEFLAGPCVVLALLFNYRFMFSEILWSFSIFLEAVAILPQLFMLQRTGEAETITTHYLAALGAYRAFYIPNWIYRCVALSHSLCHLLCFEQ